MIAIASALYLVRDVLVAIFFAVVISAGLSPLIDYLEDRGVPRMLSTIAIYLSALLIFGLVIYAVLPIAIVEFSGLFANVAKLTGDVFNFSSTSDLLNTLNDNFHYISSGILEGGFSFFSIASGLFGGIAFAISVAVTAFYLSLSRQGVEWFLRAIMPERSEERVIRIFQRSKKRIGYWLQSQILLSFIVGIMSFLGLWLLGVEHAFILGLTAALFELIPYVGPVFAGSIAVLVALSSSFTLGLYVVALFVIIQQIESQIIIPAVFHRAIGLHPVVVLAALMMGYTLLGFVGIILSVPAAVILQEILNDWVSIKDHRRANLIQMEGGGEK